MIYSEDIPFHPAFGYATREQVEKLNELKKGSAFVRLKQQIQFQSDHKGKVKGKEFLI